MSSPTLTARSEAVATAAILVQTVFPRLNCAAGFRQAIVFYLHALKVSENNAEFGSDL